MSSQKTKSRKKDIIKVKPPLIKGSGKELPLKGSELIDQQYCNVFLAAVTKSGKTVTISHVLRNVIDKRTRVVIFAHTADIDKTYVHLIKWLKKHNIDHVVYKNLVDGKVNNLQNELNLIEQKHSKEKEKDDDDEDSPSKQTNVMGVTVPNSIYQAWTNEDIKKFMAKQNEQQKPKEKKEKENKYKDRVPENVFILDDLSKRSLRSSDLVNLLKESRHYKLRVFISSQGILHLQPDAMSNLYEIWLYKGFSRRQIFQLAERINTSLSAEQLYNLYKTITSHKYQFMNMNLIEDTIRPSFYKPINLKKVKEL